MNDSYPGGSMESLQALITRALAGDQGAYANLYDHYATGLYRLAYSILLDEQDSEDVLQESFIYAFRNLHRYDPERGAFHTWLYTITVSRCRNMRRRKVLPTVELVKLLAIGQEPAASHRETPEAALARLGVRHALEHGLKTLSPRLREAVALRYGQGLTYREMADVLGCPQKTAESRIRLAHEALARALGESGQTLLEELWGF
ncbi:MAG: sigma-70 family RNA polymerase sigma factor [Anaerolineae bacterium]|nr:sigma-70 family RNA polymerase sigma factor [Anaerolineae bacterium]